MVNFGKDARNIDLNYLHAVPFVNIFYLLNLLKILYKKLYNTVKEALYSLSESITDAF